MAHRKTIDREELARLSVINSKRMPTLVNDNGVLREWVGIGWITLKQKPKGHETRVIDAPERKR